MCKQIGEDRAEPSSRVTRNNIFCLLIYNVRRNVVTLVYIELADSSKLQRDVLSAGSPRDALCSGLDARCGLASS